MVKVDVYRRDKRIYKLEIYDHAGSGDYGFDLVCAAVSAISIGALNALDQMAVEADLVMDPSPYVMMQVMEDDHAYLDFVYYQLKSIESSYAQYISIREKEEVR